MRDHYDFSSMKGKKNPYLKYLRKPITIQIDTDSINYSQSLAKEKNMPYQKLINLYLQDCAINDRTLTTQKMT